MKNFVKFISIVIVMTIIIISLPSLVLAATTDTVTITATPSYIAIDNDPATWSIGAIAVSATSATAANYYTITNTSSVAINVSIWCTATFIGGNAWTLASDGAPGSMIVGLYAGTVSGTWDKVVSASPGQVLKSLAASANQSWHMKLWAPTVFTDGAEKTGVITISAVAS